MKHPIARLAFFAVLLVSPRFALPQDSLPLRAGAATSVITPELGLDIIGGFVPSPSKHIHDELHARCLVLDDGKTKLAFVVCDLLGLHRSLSVEARRLIQESSGIPSENVLISGTHTHSAASAFGNTTQTRSWMIINVSWHAGLRTVCDERRTYCDRRRLRLVPLMYRNISLTDAG